MTREGSTKFTELRSKKVVFDKQMEHILVECTKKAIRMMILGSTNADGVTELTPGQFTVDIDQIFEENGDRIGWLIGWLETDPETLTAE